MRAIEIGNLRMAHNDDEQLPKSGIVIEATQEEIEGIFENLLFKELVIKAKGEWVAK